MSEETTSNKKVTANSSAEDKKWARPFFTIWIGQALSLVGSRVGGFALVWWLTQETGGSATTLSLMTLVAMLPGVILGPFVGALVDRWNRRRVMIVADSLIALFSAGLAVLFWLARPLLFLPLLLLALPEIWGGNITILLAAAIVLGFSRPFAWAFPLLTNLTPGVGILWFAVRREWVSFGLAVAATVAVIATAALVTPGLWADWFQLLLSSTGSSTVEGAVPIPLLARLPFALAIIAVAAWRDMRWLLPIGVLLAMPVIWWGSLALLTASVALKRDDIEDGFETLLLWLNSRYRERVAASGAAASS